MSLEEDNWVPQSAQKGDVSGLDKRHFGHVTAISDPSPCPALVFYERKYERARKFMRQAQIYAPASPPSEMAFLTVSS